MYNEKRIILKTIFLKFVFDQVGAGASASRKKVENLSALLRYKNILSMSENQFRYEKQKYIYIYIYSLFYCLIFETLQYLFLHLNLKCFDRIILKCNIDVKSMI